MIFNFITNYMNKNGSPNMEEKKKCYFTKSKNTLTCWLKLLILLALLNRRIPPLFVAGNGIIFRSMLTGLSLTVLDFVSMALKKSFSNDDNFAACLLFTVYLIVSICCCCFIISNSIFFGSSILFFDTNELIICCGGGDGAVNVDDNDKEWLNDNNENEFVLMERGGGIGGDISGGLSKLEFVADDVNEINDLSAVDESNEDG